MAENTKIEWAHHTFNPWEGCTKVGPGCDHCYAETRNNRFGGGNWGHGAPRRRTSPSNWHNPLRWNRQAAEQGIRYRVFCASLADVFDNEAPIEWRRDLFDLIASTPHLDWLLLTKRIGNVMPMVSEVADHPRSASHDGDLMAHHWRNGTPPANVWLGATVVNQQEADRDIPRLLGAPAALRWLSMEPLLGPVALCKHVHDNGIGRVSMNGIDWVIVGGESGPGARPMHPDWARSLRDQCAAAGVPFLFKQWGEWAAGEAPPWPENADYAIACGKGHYFDDMQWMDRMGKKRAGRLLDGEQHDGFPSSPAEGRRDD